MYCKMHLTVNITFQIELSYVLQVVYSHSGKVGEVKEEKKVEQEEDDFDIDAI